MKRIAEAELTRAAFSKGAVVSMDGRTLNASGSRMTLAAPPEKPPTPPTLPPAPPPPVRVEIDTNALIHAGNQQAERLGAMVAALVTELRAQRDANPAPILAWDFEIVRDNKDRLQTLRATAIR